MSILRFISRIRRLSGNLELLRIEMFRSDAESLGRKFTVFVEGNIGSGKTTFLNNFKDSNALILSEPVNLWRSLDGHNLLGKLYDDSTRWGFMFQSYVQLTMLDLHLKQSNASLKLMERSIHSARYCFVENLHRNKMMTDAELAVLDHWYKWINSNVNVGGDLIVYLRTTPEVVYERMRARARKEESCVPLEYLKKLHDLHEEWMIHKTHATCPAEVIVVDANRDLVDLEDDVQKLKSDIMNHCQPKVSIMT